MLSFPGSGPFGFPGSGWSWVSWFALVPAGLAARRTRDWRRVYWTSSIVFMLWWAWMLRWLWPVTGPGMIALAVWLGLNVGLAVLATGVLAQKGRWPMTLALPMGWVSIEVLRSVWPVGGLSWFSLAQTQAVWRSGEVGMIVQCADILGQHTVGVVVAAFNGMLVDVAVRRHPPRTLIGAVVLLVAVAWGYGKWRVSQFDAVTSAGPRVAAIQTNVEQDNEVAPTIDQMLEDWSDLVGLHGKAIEEATARGEPLTVVLWPETMVPAPLNDQGVAEMRELAASPGMSEGGRYYYGLKAQYAERVSEMARATGVPVVVGASTREFEPHVRRYNSAYLVKADGGFAEPVYHKQHRVPLGEYIPGPGFIGSLVAKFSPWESEYTLTPGDGPVVYTLPGGWQVGTPICYEDAIAGVCRRMVYADGRKRLDLLLNLTNDGWYSGRGMRRQHAQLASLRCIENRVPMARSVNTGLTTLIDSMGRAGAQVPAFEPGAAVGEMRVDSRETFYAWIGGWPWALYVLGTLVATVLAAMFGRPVARHRIA